MRVGGVGWAGGEAGRATHQGTGVCEVGQRIRRDGSGKVEQAGRAISVSLRGRVHIVSCPYLGSLDGRHNWLVCPRRPCKPNTTQIAQTSVRNYVRLAQRWLSPAAKMP